MGQRDSKKCRGPGTVLRGRENLRTIPWYYIGDCWRHFTTRPVCT